MNYDTVHEVFRYPGRATRAIVDLDAISTNIRILRGEIGASTALMAVVKANAYGHGAVPIANAALEAGADHLAVSMVDEAVQLRSASIRAPILILGPIDESEIDLAIGHGVELSIGSLRFARAVARAAEQFEVTSPVRVHLKIDTGMHRFGAFETESLEIARYIEEHPLLRFRGLFTHFARADEEDGEPTEEQAVALARIVDALAEMEIRPEIVHQSNSAAAIRSRSFDLNMVRVGIAMYGLHPSGDVSLLDGMRPAMTIVSKIARVFSLQPGDEVSYGGTYRAQVPTRAALIPIGYGDGYPRGLSNRSDMYVHGSQCPILGRICMDQTIIQLPNELEATVGDPVIVSGGWASEGVRSFEDLAEMTGTINYEIATRVASRLPRFYLRNGKVVSLSDLAGHRAVASTLPSNE